LEIREKNVGSIYNVDSHRSRGSGGATIGKIIFTYVYIEKKTFSRTSWPISIKLGKNHPWVKGILNCSNKGLDHLQRGDNHKNAMGWGHLKIFSRTTEPE
jgi:hypothetical protein